MKPPTDEVREAIVSDARDGATLRQLTHQHHLGTRAVKQILAEEYVPIRPQGGRDLDGNSVGLSWEEVRAAQVLNNRMSPSTVEELYRIPYPVAREAQRAYNRVRGLIHV